MIFTYWTVSAEKYSLMCLENVCQSSLVSGSVSGAGCNQPGTEDVAEEMLRSCVHAVLYVQGGDAASGSQIWFESDMKNGQIRSRPGTGYGIRCNGSY